MRRIVEPEILDHLDVNDPEAIASRKDLHLLNRIMGHASIMNRAFDESDIFGLPSSRPVRIADLGGGDGSLLLHLARSWSAKGIRANAHIIDRHDLIDPDTKNSFCELGWTVEPVIDEVVHWMTAVSEPVDWILVNLFLHHFDREGIEDIFRFACERSRLFISCEPRRNHFSLSSSRLVGLLGCNRVTRNDAVISVRAGFAESELSQLWPQKESWKLTERRAGLFSHLFLAVKR